MLNTEESRSMAAGFALLALLLSIIVLATGPIGLAIVVLCFMAFVGFIGALIAAKFWIDMKLSHPHAAAIFAVSTSAIVGGILLLQRLLPLSPL